MKLPEKYEIWVTNFEYDHVRMIKSVATLDLAMTYAEKFYVEWYWETDVLVYNTESGAHEGFLLSERTMRQHGIL